MSILYYPKGKHAETAWVLQELGKMRAEQSQDERSLRHEIDMLRTRVGALTVLQDKVRVLEKRLLDPVANWIADGHYAIAKNGETVCCQDTEAAERVAAILNGDNP